MMLYFFRRSNAQPLVQVPEPTMVCPSAGPPEMGPLMVMPLPVLMKIVPAPMVPREAIEAAGDHVVVVQERQRLVPGPELGDGDVRVDAVGGGDDTLIVVVGVEPTCRP